ncbi:hypothetical protein [Photobacterium phosphoreum]
MGLVGEIEREFIRIRIKEALAARKMKGQMFGCLKWSAKRLKLDNKQE